MLPTVSLGDFGLRASVQAPDRHLHQPTCPRTRISCGTRVDVWDWAPGEDFVARMAAALERADRLLAVCSEAYFSSVFGGAELRAAFVGSAAAEGRIVPVLVEPVTLPPLYASLIHLDLTGLDEAAAAARLRERLAGTRPTGP